VPWMSNKMALGRPSGLESSEADDIGALVAPSRVQAGTGTTW
jgi:hypothetical protein